MSDTAVSAAGMRVVKLLVGSPPQTVADLIQATGVTRTAVTEQLNELVAAGFVERTTERLPGRGRPRHLYCATEAALVLLFASNQRLVVPAIWRAVESIGGGQLVSTVLDQVAEELAEHYRRRLTATEPAERLQQFSALLAEEGVIVHLGIEAEGGLTFSKRSCPFISMYDQGRCVCRVDQEMIAKIVGAPLVQVACRHDGAPCCSFRLASNGVH